ncbi:MAG: AtpZ/AtpI family protein [Balneolaceae bacterium]
MIPGGGKNLKYVSLGIEIAAGLGVPIIAGVWIDKTFETLPWFTFSGILLGVATTILILVRLAKDDE